MTSSTRRTKSTDAECSMLDSLLATAAARAAKAKADATRAAKAQEAAELEAACDATNVAFAAIADATAAAKDTGGNPGVTAFMGNLTAFAVCGTMPATSTASAPDFFHVDGGVPQETHDAVVAERDAAYLANRDLQTRVDGLTASVEERVSWISPEDHENALATARDGWVSQEDHAAVVDALQEDRDRFVGIVDALPRIDTTRTTAFGGEVKVPMTTARAVNVARQSMRSMLGLDEPAPAGPVPGL